MKKLLSRICAVICLVGVLAPAANALILNIDVGDRPYYVHGPGYWSGRVYYVWVPGHHVWRHGHRVWIHGHYRPR